MEQIRIRKTKASIIIMVYFRIAVTLPAVL